MNELEILKAASAKFAQVHPPLRLLVLFGSRARGDADSSSDWDFAFLCEPSSSKPEKVFWFPGADILDTLQTLTNLSDNNIDLVDLGKGSEILAHFVARDGQVIYEKSSGEFSHFQQQALKNPNELKQFRHTQREKGSSGVAAMGSMSKLDPEAIAQKLTRMVERIDRLKQFEALTLEDYLRDDLRQAAIERLLELIIDSALSINKTLLKRAVGLTPLNSSTSFKNFESFILVGENGCIPQKLAEQLAPSGSFRNALAHEYDEIDPVQVYSALQKALSQYPQYVKAIQMYLDAIDEE